MHCALRGEVVRSIGLGFRWSIVLTISPTGRWELAPILEPTWRHGGSTNAHSKLVWEKLQMEKLQGQTFLKRRIYKHVMQTAAL
jgi:hypothetical protein